MLIHNLIKRIKIVVAVFVVPILVCLVGLGLTACTPQDLNADEAARIAIEDFGCDRVLWVQTGALMLGKVPGSKPEKYRFKSNYTYYVVGEKAGQEVYIIIPCRPDLDKPYITIWCLDHTFSEVADKFNENGANYHGGVFDDSYDTNQDYINFEPYPEYVKRYADNYDVGCDGETFYERLDVKGVFHCRWIEEDIIYDCIVTQENGELKAYKKTKAMS